MKKEKTEISYTLTENQRARLSQLFYAVKHLPCTCVRTVEETMRHLRGNVSESFSYCDSCKIFDVAHDLENELITSIFKVKRVKGFFRHCNKY